MFTLQKLLPSAPFAQTLRHLVIPFCSNAVRPAYPICRPFATVEQSKMPKIVFDPPTAAKRSTIADSGPETLFVGDLSSLPALVQDFESDQSLSAKTKAISLSDDQDDSEVADEIVMRRISTACSALATLLDAITQKGSLESFKWAGAALQYGNGNNFRAEIFWQALSRTAATLQHLELDFYVHEVANLEKSGGKVIFPRDFPALKSLRLGLTGGHGNDASVIDTMLRHSTGLVNLSLDLPICDLESCRLQGLTYGYHFPKLTTLCLSVYSKDPAIATFLSRHPSITTLSLNLGGDVPFVDQDTLLPNLRSLAIESSDKVDFLTPSALRPITHLRMGRCPHDRYQGIKTVSKTLRFLELSLDVDSMREEDGLPSIIKDLLSDLPDIRELAIVYHSASITWSDENKNAIHPEPASINDLKQILSYLPADSRLRALRMSDNAETSPLHEKTKLDLGQGPSTLQFLQWDTATRSSLYTIPTEDHGSIANDLEPVRDVSKGPGGNSFSDETILVHQT